MGRHVLVLVAIAVLAGHAEASAKGVPISGIRWEVDLPSTQNTWVARQIGNCTIFLETGWKEGFDKKKKLTYFVGGGPARGTLDVEGRRGAAADKGVALDFDALPKTGGRSWQLAQPGIELAGRKAYVTALVRNAKSRLSAVKRSRIAVIVRPKVLSGPAHDPAHKGETFPDSYLVAVQGRAKILPALTAAFERSRCKSKRQAGYNNGPIRPGTLFGFVTAQLLPAAAVGLAGTADIVDGPVLESDEDAKVDVQPIAPAKFVTVNHARNTQFPMAPGIHTALVCESGYRCTPTGGGVLSLLGGVTYAYSGRTATVTDLTLTYTELSSGGIVPGVEGTVDGVRMTISVAGRPGGTDEYLAHLSQALGLTVSSSGLGLVPTFTSTGPA